MQVEGQRGESLLSLPATGARVSNTYVTCPCQGDNPGKPGLIPRTFRGGIPPGCPGGIYAGLARLSTGCPPAGGRLHTCYSPVRRSPPRKASFPRAAPRLACVKPAASVHPEPGSNSPLVILFSFLRIVCIPPCSQVEPLSIRSCLTFI